MEEFNKNQIVTKDDTVTSMMVGRQAQEVQAAIIVAKRFPRDENESYKRIMRSCARIGLAEQAEYTYPKGDKKVAGPSIRLAESIAQSWGNIDYGIIELENEKGSSEMLAYCWDLETNTRVTKVFTVKHWRDTKGGGYALKDSRDVYETTANFGARRVRACILGVIPGDVIEGAVKECRKTIKGDNKTPIEDRIKVMLNTFEKEHRVTTAMVEEYLGCNVKSISENELIRMKGVHQSITDGMSAPRDYFNFGDAPAVDAPPVVDAFKKAPEAAAVPETKATVIDEDSVLRAKLIKAYPGEESWQTDARIKEIKEARP
jgi:hypothetical protein